jgi:hypothetical protein
MAVYVIEPAKSGVFIALQAIGLEIFTVDMLFGYHACSPAT